jgi:hypothetical protein
LLEENPESIDTSGLAVQALAGEALGAALLEIGSSFFDGGVNVQLFFNQISSAFLPIVDYKRWAQVLEEVETPEEESELTAEPDGRPHEWTTYVRGSSWRGALLPEDDGPIEAVSVFTRFGGLLRALRFVREGPDIHASVNLNRHCGLPDFNGSCSPGYCGECQSRRRVIPPRGIICFCDHG